MCSNYATMRFAPESDHGANAGLNVARDLMEKVKQEFPWISYGDLWTLGGVAAVQVRLFGYFRLSKRDSSHRKWLDQKSHGALVVLMVLLLKPPQMDDFQMLHRDLTTCERYIVTLSLFGVLIIRCIDFWTYGVNISNSTELMRAYI
jgi:hypothetical protein